MTRNQKLKKLKKTGQPYIDNQGHKVWRRLQAEVNDSAFAPWSSLHVGLPRKKKKRLKRVGMELNLIHVIATHVMEVAYVRFMSEEAKGVE